MKLPPLGSDPMDTFSKPLKSKKTKLATLFYFNPRKIPEKPGRSLSVIWDKRCPFVDGYENNYQYIVNFDKSGEKAGGHYHHDKQELFIPLVGQIKVVLEDITTKEKEEIILDSGDQSVLYIKPPLAHVVISQTELCSLLVIATYPNNLMDEFPYQINP